MEHERIYDQALRTATAESAGAADLGQLREELGGMLAAADSVLHSIPVVESTQYLHDNRQQGGQ